MKTIAKSDHDVSWVELHWEDAATPEMVGLLLERFATAVELGRITLELRASKETVHWLIGVAPEKMLQLKQLLSELLPVADFTVFRRKRLPIIEVARVGFAKPSLALDATKAVAISRTLLASLTKLQDGEQVVLQVLLGERISPAFTNAQPAATWWELLTGSKTRPLPADALSRLKYRNQLHGFKTLISIGVTADTPGAARGLVLNVFGALRVTETSGTRLRLLKDKPHRFNQALSPWKYPLALSSGELVGLIGWPVGTTPLPLISSTHPRKVKPNQTLTKTERIIGVTTGVGEPVKLGISTRDSLFHTMLLGPTGSGKSTVMLNLIQADINAGLGMLVIDPKTDLVTDILARIPNNRMHDVVVIDPTSTTPIGLNPLQDSHRSPELAADTLLASFKHVFHDSWGIRTEDILTASFLTLARVKGANLLWLPALLTDKSFRKKILKQVNDPLGTDTFWARYDALRPEQQAVEIQPVLNKLRQFLLRPAMRAVLGQTNPKFTLNELFTQRRIVLVSLNKGLLGAENARLLGSLIVGQLWPLTLARARLPATRRHPVSVYIDEVQDYLSLPVDLADALAQSRSLGVAYHVAHQYRAQLSPQMRAAFDTNTRNKIIFGLSGQDATDLAKHATGLKAEDFMLLPQYEAYAQTMQSGKQTNWVSIKTTPPTPAMSDPVAIKATSEDRYGTAASETEAEVLGLISHEPEPPDQTETFGRKPT